MRLDRRCLVVSAVALVATAAPLAAQHGGDPSHAHVALGPAIASGLYTGMGLHIQVGGVWPRSDRLAIRGDLLAGMLGSAGAAPLCVAGPCNAYALSPDQVYSTILSAEIRPVATARRLFALVGFGAYHGRGTASTNFGFTGGPSAGGGLDLTRGHGAGFVLEARYHRLLHQFGGTTGIVTSSLGFRF